MTKFKEYVRSASFHLSLSANQIRVLHSLITDDDADRGHNSLFVMGAKQIEEKVLIEHHEYPVGVKGRDNKYIHEYTGIVSGERPAYTITKPGRMVWKLLNEAGFNQ